MARCTAIIKYNGIIARRSKARASEEAAPRPRRPRLHIGGCYDRFPVPKMPKMIQLLMLEGTPIGSKAMRNAITGEPYFKYDGLKDTRARHIAEYLISISGTDRKEIFDTMLATTRHDALRKILDFYQKLLKDSRTKNEYLIKTGEAVSCDMSGVLH